MKIPWYIEITNEEGWEILLEQVECGALGPAYIADWPCFRGYRDEWRFLKGFMKRGLLSR